jgi:hypothetical protein
MKLDSVLGTAHAIRKPIIQTGFQRFTNQYFIDLTFRSYSSLRLYCLTIYVNKISVKFFMNLYWLSLKSPLLCYLIVYGNSYAILGPSPPPAHWRCTDRSSCDPADIKDMVQGERLLYVRATERSRNHSHLL